MIDFNPALEQLQAMWTGLLGSLPNLLLALAIFLIVWVISNGVRDTISRATRLSHLNDGAVYVVARLARWGVLTIGILLVLPIIFDDFSVTNIVSVLGVGSVAIGLAFQDIFENFVAGILILITQPFEVGDQIVYGDYEGTIEHVHTRATYLRTYDGRRVVIPNADLFTNSVTVNTAFTNRRSEYDVGIGYGDDIDLARQVMVEAIAAHDIVLDDPSPEAFVIGLGDSAVLLRVRWWTKSTRREVVGSTGRVLQSVKEALDANGVNIPFPIRTVYFHNEAVNAGEFPPD